MRFIVVNLDGVNFHSFVAGDLFYFLFILSRFQTIFLTVLTKGVSNKACIFQSFPVVFDFGMFFRNFLVLFFFWRPVFAFYG